MAILEVDEYSIDRICFSKSEHVTYMYLLRGMCSVCSQTKVPRNESFRVASLSIELHRKRKQSKPVRPFVRCGEDRHEDRSGCVEGFCHRTCDHKAR